MSDVSERSTMNDSRSSFQSLNQVRLQSIFQKSCHSSFGMQITSSYRFLLCYFTICITNDDSGKSLLKVCNITCQTQNCHNLRCNGDIISVLSRHSIGLSAKSVYYITKLTVIHIHTSSPCDLSRVDVQRIALEDMVVDHCCQQVVSCTDCMEVTGEMKIDVLHRNNLCVSAACCSTFYSEYRS